MFEMKLMNSILVVEVFCFFRGSFEAGIDAMRLKALDQVSFLRRELHLIKS